MTLDEAIKKLEFMKRAYQELRDANIMNGIVSGNAGEIKGEWHSDWHVLEAYQKHIDALEMAIKALEQEPCGDCISRQNAIEAFQIFREYESNRSNKEWVDRIETVLNQLPPVTPQPKVWHCKDCKYFEYDSMAMVDGIPIIVAHEICSKWGKGCKTKKDGYCFLYEPQESEE